MKNPLLIPWQILKILAIICLSLATGQQHQGGIENRFKSRGASLPLPSSNARSLPPTTYYYYDPIVPVSVRQRRQRQFGADQVRKRARSTQLFWSTYLLFFCPGSASGCVTNRPGKPGNSANQRTPTPSEVKTAFSGQPGYVRLFHTAPAARPDSAHLDDKFCSLQSIWSEFVYTFASWCKLRLSSSLSFAPQPVRTGDQPAGFVTPTRGCDWPPATCGTDCAYAE